MLKIGVVGCTGRMGRFILQAVHDTKNCDVSGGSVRPGSVSTGKPLSQLINGYESLKITDSGDVLFEASDAVIDFTTAGATSDHLDLAKKYNVPLVIGTSGFTQADDEKMTTTGKSVPIFQAYNMSFGNTLMIDMVEKISAVLDESFDIEIFEMHHARKKDAPSGTGLNLGRAAARGRGITLKEPVDMNRDRLRTPGEIGFSISRGGNVTGDHSVNFAGDKEMLTLSHRAFSPDIFAQGAVKAAQWLANQKPGRYDMKDVLGL